MFKKFFRKLLSAISVAVIAATCFLVCGCTLFSDGTDILSVRERVDELRGEMTKTLGEGFIAGDKHAVKELFCPKSQALPDIEEQIEKTFSFIDGKILSYKIGERGYESYASEDGTVVDYEFDSKVFMTSSSGKEYCLTFRAYFLAERPILGMTAYTLEELHSTAADFARAGYYWMSPYDGECGSLSAALIECLGKGDGNKIKDMMCAKVSESAETQKQIDSAITSFEGAPLFTRREDGLYNLSDSEEDFTLTVLACNVERIEGEIADVWLHVIVRSISTDANRKYDLDIVLYLQSDSAPERKGICLVSLSDSKTNKTIVSVGEWID